MPVHSVKKKRKKVVEADFDNEMSTIDRIYASVSLISGYDRASIDRDAEFEGDLGIDTLKIFEILSRLRGNVLPQQVENFRELTSVQKILTAAERHAEGGEKKEAKSRESNLEWFKYKTVKTAQIDEDVSVGSLDEFGIDRLDAPYHGDKKGIILARPLSSTMKSAAVQLLR